MATLLQDNFDRANSSTVLGSPQIGPAPTVVAGVVGITSNTAYGPTTPGTAVYALGTPNVELSATIAGLSGGTTGTFVLGYAALTDMYLVSFYIDKVELWRFTPGGAGLMATSTVKPPTTSGLCRAHYRDGIIRAYVQDVLVMRFVLESPITANSHGIRFGTTASRMDDLLGTDAPTITEPVLTATRLEQAQTFIPTTPVVPPSFAYLGRDTKLQDISEGA